MKKLLLPILILFFATQVNAITTNPTHSPLGCYDTLTIHRVSGPIYVTNDKNNTYKDISGLDKHGGVIAALYESDTPMREKLKKQGLCEVYNYLNKN